MNDLKSDHSLQGEILEGVYINKSREWIYCTICLTTYLFRDIALKCKVNPYLYYYTEATRAIKTGLSIIHEE